MKNTESVYFKWVIFDPRYEEWCLKPNGTGGCRGIYTLPTSNFNWKYEIENFPNCQNGRLFSKSLLLI